MDNGCYKSFLSIPSLSNFLATFYNIAQLLDAEFSMYSIIHNETNQATY